MLALGQYRAGLCRQCGDDLARTTDPDNDPDNPDATHQYVATPPLECFRCKVLTRSERAYHEHDTPGALLHLVTLKPRPHRRR